MGVLQFTTITVGQAFNRPAVYMGVDLSFIRKCQDNAPWTTISGF